MEYNIGKIIAFDFYGGIVAGLGLNILSGMIIGVNNKAVILRDTLFMAYGLIISGVLIAVSRAVLGRINEIAKITKENRPKEEFEEIHKRIAGVKGLISLVSFWIGIILSVLCLTKIFLISLGTFKNLQ